jgi:predicted membrane channel-forming protein YqfA (hemolysin III family)
MQVKCWPESSLRYLGVAHAEIHVITLVMSTCSRFRCAANNSSISLRCVCHPAGIAVLIVASFFPPVYYGFMCHLPTQIFYLTTTTVLGNSPALFWPAKHLHCARACMVLMVALPHQSDFFIRSEVCQIPPAGLICMAVSLLEFFQDYRYRPLRAGMYVSLGLWGAVPAIHAWHKLGSFPEVRKALQLDVLMGILYVVRSSASCRCKWICIAMGYHRIPGAQITSEASRHSPAGWRGHLCFQVPRVPKTRTLRLPVQLAPAVPRGSRAGGLRALSVLPGASVTDCTNGCGVHDLPHAALTC